MKSIRRIPNPVPRITNPLGEGLRQPDADDMQFFQNTDGTEMFVKITDLDFYKLSRRDWGLPTGVYEGKMWNCKDTHLVWFDTSPTDKDMCTTYSAKIIEDK